MKCSFHQRFPVKRNPSLDPIDHAQLDMTLARFKTFPTETRGTVHSWHFPLDFHFFAPFSRQRLHNWPLLNPGACFFVNLIYWMTLVFLSQNSIYLSFGTVHSVTCFWTSRGNTVDFSLVFSPVSLLFEAVQQQKRRSSSHFSFSLVQEPLRRDPAAVDDIGPGQNHDPKQHHREDCVQAPAAHRQHSHVYIQQTLRFVDLFG